MQPSPVAHTTLVFSPSFRFVQGLLSLGGAVWGLWYFGMDWIGWGQPGTAEYARYELYNQVAPVVFLLLIGGTQLAHRSLRTRYGRWGSAGAHLACVGLVVMAIGSALEFVVFTDTAYQTGSLRGIGWGTYCIGLLLFYLGTALFGASLRKLPGLQIAGTMLMVWLPVGALSAGLNALTGLSLPGLSIAVAICGVGYILLALGMQATLRTTS